MSKRVSTGKSKKGAPKHKNQFAFVPNKFSSVALKIASTPIVGVCKRCTDILEWRQRMGKYKPLTQPKTCVNCGLKKIVHAYHVFCGDCSKEKKVCAKCHESNEIVIPVESDEKDEKEILNLVSRLPERQRRAYNRKMENGDCEGAQAILSNIVDNDFEWSGGEESESESELDN